MTNALGPNAAQELTNNAQIIKNDNMNRRIIVISPLLEPSATHHTLKVSSFYLRKPSFKKVYKSRAQTKTIGIIQETAYPFIGPDLLQAGASGAVVSGWGIPVFWKL